MTISRTIIEKPRKARRCDYCHKAIQGRTVRLYGMAEQGDPPYAMFLHPSCEHSTVDDARAIPSVPLSSDRHADRDCGGCRPWTT